LSVVSRIIEQLRESRANPELGVEGIVMTMFDARTRLSTEVVNEVREHFGDAVFQTVIPRNIRLGEAPSFGQPVMMYDPTCAGSDAYRRLAREYLERIHALAAEPVEDNIAQKQEPSL
jgi:chromosome partitioning protein